MQCEGIYAASGQPTEMLCVKFQLLRKMTNNHLAAHFFYFIFLFVCFGHGMCLCDTKHLDKHF